MKWGRDGNAKYDNETVSLQQEGKNVSMEGEKQIVDDIRMTVMIHAKGRRAFWYYESIYSCPFREFRP
jgi:hypothetical protein